MSSLEKDCKIDNDKFKNQTAKRFKFALDNLFSKFRNFIYSVKIEGVHNVIRCCGVKIKTKLPTTENEIKILEYLSYKKKHKANGVVYTCITNDYDDIREIEAYRYVNKDWDYICFTDNANDIAKGQVGIWEIRPLVFEELDNTRNNRWHKLHPHILFKEYDESIYIDPNINILSGKLFEEIKGYNFRLPKHYKNNCIYDEFSDVKSIKLDSPELINSELELIKGSGMPKNWGFAENNILYRKHNIQQIIDIDNEWWEMVKNYSKRDQLSFAYILWKNGVDINKITFENTKKDSENFCVFPHKGRK